jgi:protein disulfide-isomerase A1
MLKAFFIAFLFAVAARAGDDLDLDETNFDETIKNNDYVLVMFYAPWCGHCKSFKPHFAAAATKAAGKYVLAKVDCTQDSAKGLCQQQEVRGYPTVKFFKHGSAQEYTGPRDTEGVLGWLEKKTGPAALTLASAEEVKTFVADHGESTIVTGYFDKEDSEAHKEFIEAANDADMEEFKFVQAFGTDQKDGSITLHFKGQAQTRPDGENIARWAFENSFPLVDEVGGHNFARYAKLGKPLHLVFVEPTDEGKDALVANLETVAAEHKDESFSWIDANKYKAQIKGMGASGDVIPCIIRLSSFGSDNKPVVFEEPLTLDSLRDWAAGVKSGKFKYVPKSEPIPEDNSGPVKTLVGKNWDDIVNDASKNVLVEFYAPWCGHCKNLAPKYEELGTKFADSDDVIIAKIDGTANDVESHVEIRGFPTLVLYTKTGKATPITYSGEREADALESWINEKKE